MPTPIRIDLAAITDELLEGWEAFTDAVELTDRGTGARIGRDRTPAQTVVVLGLVTHVHEVARVLRPALPDGLTVAHMPLVRSIWEATLTAVWCDEVADGAAALMREEGRPSGNSGVGVRVFRSEE